MEKMQDKKNKEEKIINENDIKKEREREQISKNKEEKKHKRNPLFKEPFSFVVVLVFAIVGIVLGLHFGGVF